VRKAQTAQKNAYDDIVRALAQRVHQVENQAPRTPPLHTQVNWGQLPTWDDDHWNIATQRDSFAGLAAHALLHEEIAKRIDELVAKEDSTVQDFADVLVAFGIPPLEHIKKHAASGASYDKLVRALHSLTRVNNVDHTVLVPANHAHTAHVSFTADF
jgi:hypothetical protein